MRDLSLDTDTPGLRAVLHLRDAAVLCLAGELDAANANALRQALGVAVDQARDTPARQLIVDLRDVPFADSSALNALIGGRRYGQAHDVELRLQNLHPLVARVLAITGLTRAFPVQDTDPTTPDPAAGTLDHAAVDNPS